ncbi:translation initiation factor eIF3 subunit [Laetiporus sulphureus 93-53]|uniref:Eukaryotic translation initiation factor 3 subunit J n=1 Tax=Laetiporus sulphureus 93-53 TaxID=1314785 RepID=A0A165C6G7_9APHY|nr:translation initiation factor eIF3 subunit [Laetiporus sulphureus 93-53]KZT02286.1 translation initiation factor eIF3 subunit [Laetiporus sulphureus 93-53]
MSDWESSEDEIPTTAPPAPIAKKPVKSKWEGEDEEDDAPISDWEASSDEEEKPAKPAAAAAAPPKKKGTLKAKLAEIEAAKAARAVAEDEEYDEDAVLDPREKARRDQERELQADLANASELLGAAALGGTSSSELDSLISAQPRTKEDFIKFSDQIIEFIIKRHQDKPLYAAFLEYHVRSLAIPLRDVEVRKTASVLTTLANEKQKEQKDKASGKKKPKLSAKPVLGAAKLANKIDTTAYDEALDDFADNDFM